LPILYISIGFLAGIGATIVFVLVAASYWTKERDRIEQQRLDDFMKMVHESIMNAAMSGIVSPQRCKEEDDDSDEMLGM
jgi:hypothetical protein